MNTKQEFEAMKLQLQVSQSSFGVVMLRSAARPLRPSSGVFPRNASPQSFESLQARVK